MCERMYVNALLLSHVKRGMRKGREELERSRKQSTEDGKAPSSHDEWQAVMTHFKSGICCRLLQCLSGVHRSAVHRLGAIASPACDGGQQLIT